MEIGDVISKINHAVPGAYLHKNRFGRSNQVSIWIDLRKIREVASFLRNDLDLLLDCFENLSVAQVDDSLVLTYFVRSSTNLGIRLILRGSIPLDRGADDTGWVEALSIADIWPSAIVGENEYRELFGIRFEGNLIAAQKSPSLLPEGWNGFPLRKDYIFPNQVFGIDHSRENHHVE